MNASSTWRCLVTPLTLVSLSLALLGAPLPADAAQDVAPSDPEIVALEQALADLKLAPDAVLSIADEVELSAALSGANIRVAWLSARQAARIPTGAVATLDQYRAILAVCERCKAEWGNLGTREALIGQGGALELQNACESRQKDFVKSNARAVTLGALTVHRGTDDISGKQDLGDIPNAKLTLDVNVPVGIVPATDVTDEGAFLLSVSLAAQGPAAPAESIQSIDATRRSEPVQLTIQLPDPPAGGASDFTITVTASLESGPKPDNWWPLAKPPAPSTHTFSVRLKPAAPAPNVGISRKLELALTKTGHVVEELIELRNPRKGEPDQNAVKWIDWYLGATPDAPPGVAVKDVTGPLVPYPGEARPSLSMPPAELLKAIQAYKGTRVGLAKPPTVTLEPLGSERFDVGGNNRAMEGNPLTARFAVIVEVLAEKGNIAGVALIQVGVGAEPKKYQLKKFQSAIEFANLVASVPNGPAVLAVDAGLGKERLAEFVNSLRGREITLVPCLAALNIGAPWSEENYMKLMFLADSSIRRNAENTNMLDFGSISLPLLLKP